MFIYQLIILEYQLKCFAVQTAVPRSQLLAVAVSLRKVSSGLKRDLVVIVAVQDTGPQVDDALALCLLLATPNAD